MSKNCACRFLYDSSTSADDISQLENALETHTEFKTELCFRRKNGEILHRRIVADRETREFLFRCFPLKVLVRFTEITATVKKAREKWEKEI